MSLHIVEWIEQLVTCRIARHWAATIGVLGTTTSLAAAQTAPLLTKGASVRVVIPAAEGRPARYVSGSLVRLDNDTIVLNVAPSLALPELVRYGLNDGLQVEERVTGPGHGGTGAAVGALVGVVAGAAIGAGTWKPCTGFCPGDSPGTAAAGGVLIGGVGGAILGWAIGSSIRSATWKPVVSSTTVGFNVTF